MSGLEIATIFATALLAFSWASCIALYVVSPVVPHITGVKRNQSQKSGDFNAPRWDQRNGPLPNIRSPKFLILVIVATWTSVPLLRMPASAGPSNLPTAHL